MKAFKLITMIGLLLCTINLYAQDEINRENIENDIENTPISRTITPELKEKIYKKAERRLDVFKELLSKIVSVKRGIRENDEEIRARIDYVTNFLFIYKGKTNVQVTNSKNEKKEPQKIAPYLRALRGLSYPKVIITFPNLYFTEIKYENGYYWGTIIVKQIFQGIREDYTYKDVTYKKISFRVEFDPENSDDFDVKFGDIMVTEKSEANNGYFSYEIIK